MPGNLQRMRQNIIKLYADGLAGWDFVRQNGVAAALKRSLATDCHPLLQFIKYGVCGVFSVILWTGIMKIFSVSFANLLDENLNTDQASRAFWFLAFSWITFLPVDTVVWYVNRKLVFTPGKHSAPVEFLLFTGVSAVSYAIGLILPFYLIRAFNIPNFVAQACFIVSSMLINFIVRKLFIFRG